MTKRIIFSDVEVLADNKWLKEQAVVIEHDKIIAIVASNMAQHHLPAKQYHFGPGFRLVPGFIDLHIHGAQGKDVMDADPAALHTISQALGAEGVTGFLATTITAPIPQIEAALHHIKQEQPDLPGAKLLGIHLEGPFLSPEKKGAHVDQLQLPNIELIRNWQKISGNHIKIITLAPEVTGAIDFIEAIVKDGIVASIGHTNATYAETKLAIAAGATQATHLFNAMRGMTQREPGASGALLLANEVSAELIADGIHVHPAMIDLAYRTKGKDGLILVSDAMRAKCLGNGKYDLGGQIVNVTDGQATLVDGTLAGSTLRIPDAIKNIMQFTGCSLLDAFYMASAGPAHVLGLQRQKGVIDVGYDADLVILDPTLQPVLTLASGRVIYENSMAIS